MMVPAPAAALSAAPLQGRGDVPFTDADFARIADFAYREFGLSLPESKKDLVYSRLVKRVRQLGMPRSPTIAAAGRRRRGRRARHAGVGADHERHAFLPRIAPLRPAGPAGAAAAPGAAEGGPAAAPVVGRLLGRDGALFDRDDGAGPAARGGAAEHPHPGHRRGPRDPGARPRGRLQHRGNPPDPGPNEDAGPGAGRGRAPAHCPEGDPAGALCRAEPDAGLARPRPLRRHHVPQRGDLFRQGHAGPPVAALCRPSGPRRAFVHRPFGTAERPRGGRFHLGRRQLPTASPAPRPAERNRERTPWK